MGNGREAGAQLGEQAPGRELADLRSDLTAVFRDVLNIEVPSHESDLLAAGLLDSLGFVHLLLELEQRFGVHVPAESIEPANFSSVTRIATFVMAQRRLA